MNSETFCRIASLPKDSSTKVTIRSLQFSDFRELSALLAKNQLERHPFWINSEIPEENLREFFEKMLAVHLSEEKALVAEVCGKIAGYIASYDLANHAEGQLYEELYEKYAKVRENREALPKFSEEFAKMKQKNEVLLVTALVVSKEFEGKGIGFLLFDFINYHPKCMKYAVILSRIASKGSEIISKKLGFSTIIKKTWQEMGKPWENMHEKLKEKGLSLENDGFSLVILKR